MALRALVKKADTVKKSPKSSAKTLYRSIIRELPRVMMIYDIDIPMDEAVRSIRFHFNKHGKIEDPRIFSIMLAKGYMEYEETIMQWKQRHHLLQILRPEELYVRKPLTDEEKFLLNIEDDDDFRF